MSDHFEWRTEEENAWDGPGPVRSSAKKRRRWLLPLVMFLALIVVGAVIYWQVQERVSAAEAAISDDILSSFHLIRQADQEGDLELFRNLISGSEIGWAVANQELFSNGRLFDLSPYGLGSEPRAIDDINVTLAPELNSGEISAMTTYEQSGGNVTQDTVQLLQTSVYRKGERWVWSPPRDEFWEGSATVEETYLTASYPKRDEALVLRMARDLDMLVGELCANPTQITCPDDLMVKIDFRHEPDVMVEIGERFADKGIFGTSLAGRLSRGLELGLPTPSLLGTPVDESGYQALLKGYGTQLLTGLMQRLVDAGCCGGEARRRAAIRTKLMELDLNSWSALDSEAYRGPVEGTGGDQVALLCSDGFQREQELFFLDLSQKAWRQEFLDASMLAIKALPDGNGVLLLSQSEIEDEFHSQVWRHTAEGSHPVFDLVVSRAEAEQISWEILEQQNLLVIEVPNPYQGYSRYFTIDLATCASDACSVPPESTVNRPVWSPDGSQLIMRAYGLLWWRVGSSMVPVTDGSAPFWINDETYGYARSFGREQSLVLVRTDDLRSEQVVLTTAELREALGTEGRLNRLLIGRVIAGGSAGETDSSSGPWLILAFEIGRGGNVSQARLFRFDPESEVVNVVPHSGRLLSFNVSRSKDRLAAGGFLEDEGRWEITVSGRGLEEPAAVALEMGGSADAVPSYSWSQDESWLLILEQGLLTWFQPETGKMQKARLPEAGCVQAAWYGAQNGP